MLQFQEIGNITLGIAKVALNKLEIDELGLDETDRKMLKTMIETYKRRTCADQKQLQQLLEKKQKPQKMSMNRTLYKQVFYHVL